jgi:ATP-dependent DNA helicase 2 subunit 1
VQDIVYRPLSEDSDASPTGVLVKKEPTGGDGITLLQSLLSSINSKFTPKRALFSLPFEIGPGLRIGIKGYLLVKEQVPKRSCYVWVGGEKTQIAIGSSTQYAEDSSRTVEKTEIRKAFKFGGETISFTPEELTALRTFGEPILRIIGFKPIKLLPLWANYRPSIFIYPSDTDFIGSTRVFSALHRKLLRDKLMGTAWFVARKNATPVLVAIVPSAEQYNKIGEQTSPPGLWIIQLPFADDVRDSPEIDLVKTSDVLTNRMRDVIWQLQLPGAQYDTQKYPNPGKSQGC